MTADVAPGAPGRSFAALAQEGRRRAGALAPVLGGSGFSLVIVLLVAFLIPDELSLYLGGVKITMLRLTLILLSVAAVTSFLARQGGKLYPFDKLYFGYVGWTVLCTLLNRGFGGVERAGQFMLETLILYMLVQGTVTTVNKYRAIISMLFGVVFVLMIAAFIENRTGEYHIQNFIRGLYDLAPITESISGERFGRIRAATIFTHPILYGVFCASLMAIVWYLDRNAVSRIAKVAVIVTAATLSLSSAPLIAIVMQTIFIFCERITRGVKNRFKIILTILIILYILIELTVYRGVFGILVRFVINPETAYYRLMIIEYGMQNVWAHPIFGMRMENWQRAPWMVNPTIDHNWIVQAMNGGVVSVVLLFAALVSIGRRLFTDEPPNMPVVFDHLRRGWGFMMLAVVFAGTTVHFFDKLQAYFALLIALGAAIYRMREDWRAQSAAQTDAQSNAPTTGAEGADAESGSRPRPRVWI